MQQHVMPVLDPEIAAFVHDHLESKHVTLHLGNAATKFEQNSGGCIAITLQSGGTIETDMVILSIGVRPEIGLAQSAGLAIGDRGGIAVNDRMQTSAEDIYAVGDAVEVNNFISGLKGVVALAGPANRQGRIAADVIMGSTDGVNSFRGAQATAVCGLMGLTVASTGLTEKMLKAVQFEDGADPYEKVYLHPHQHAGYYPNPKQITTKLLFSAKDGRILGAQAVGLDGVDKRIDVIAMAIQLGGTVADLLEAELCYAPQFGSAKDPVNMAGMIASNVLADFSPTVHWENLGKSDAYLLDVRTVAEFKKGHATGAVNLPLDSLRERISEIPADREIWVYCEQGQRSYFAIRMLHQNGFNVRNLSGGYLIYLAVKRFKEIP
jgi:rhodanese-related sulfurtransferase